MLSEENLENSGQYGKDEGLPGLRCAAVPGPALGEAVGLWEGLQTVAGPRQPDLATAGSPAEKGRKGGQRKEGPPVGLQVSPESLEFETYFFWVPGGDAPVLPTALT